MNPLAGPRVHLQSQQDRQKGNVRTLAGRELVGVLGIPDASPARAATCRDGFAGPVRRSGCPGRRGRASTARGCVRRGTPHVGRVHLRPGSLESPTPDNTEFVTHA